MSDTTRVRWLGTHPESRVVNSESYGIARVDALGGRLFINNTSRNLLICLPDENSLRLLSKFHRTAYPDDDDASMYDLDFHALALSSQGTYLFALSHHGLVRAFSAGDLGLHGGEPVADLIAAFHLRLPGDIERSLIVNDCFVCTSPAGYHVDDPAQPGILISRPWVDLPRDRLSPDPHSAPRISYEMFLDDWGTTTALALLRSGTALAVAAGQRIGLFRLRSVPVYGVTLAEPFWERELPVIVKFIQELPDGSGMVVAGHDPREEAGPGDWNELGGGAFFRLSVDTAEIEAQFELGIDLGWGNGAVPLVLDSDRLIGADRRGALHGFSLADGQRQTLSPPVAGEGVSLGLAHLATLDGKVVAGFNRGGHRVLVYDSRDQ